MLHALNTSIDAIAGAKTQFVKTFVTNDEIANQLQTYIDAQKAFAKNVAKSTVDFFTTVGASATAFDVKKVVKSK